MRPALLAPLTFALLFSAAHAQQSEPALNQLEKEFQRTMTGATLAGHFTRQDGAALSEDKYVIEKATKLGGDQWRFDARIQYGGKDVRVPVTLEVKWAGDTPVLTLSDSPVAGMGSYTARVVIYSGQYAGIWSAKTHGGQMFGKIVK